MKGPNVESREIEKGKETLEVFSELAPLRATVREWRSRGLRVGFVPTMGNLHDGHFSLVALALMRCDRVVASIFVNPTQFGPNEDFGRYPRTPDADLAGLQAAGCHAVWMPDVETMYPLGVERAVRMHVPAITETLDGEHRPGHFDGVATVVARLFNQVQPDVAIFGRKDYQQLAVIRAMVDDLAFPVEIVGAPIVREANGLAMSSRNQYLSGPERETAAVIRHTLLAMEHAVRAGAASGEAEASALKSLEESGFSVDYAALRSPRLTEPSLEAGSAVVALIAARLGRTRLIDNHEFVI